jgi:hypothetical protein
VLVLVHAIWQRAPHSTLQLGPFEHEKEQSSVHEAAQLAAKLRHVGAQEAAAPHSRRPQPAPVQPHVFASHGMVVVVPEHAQTTAVTSASVAPIQRRTAITGRRRPT